MIISRYLTKEVSLVSFAVTLVLLLIFLSNQLVRYLKYAANGKIAASILTQLMGFEIPFLLALILPLGLFLGILFTYSRLYADNELRVMQSSGLSMGKLTFITSGLGMFLTLIVTILMLWINPYIALKKNQLIAKSASTENILDTLIPGRFQVSPDDKKVLYVESFSRNRKEAQNIFIAQQKESSTRNAQTEWSVLSANKGAQMRDPESKQPYVVAIDGYRYEGMPGENAYKIIHFEKYAVRIGEQSLGITRTPQEVLSTPHLLRVYKQNNKNAAELQWRISVPLSVMILTLLAIPLSYIRPRQGRYAYIFPGLLLYVIYMNLLFLTRDWITRGALSPDIGMWWVHGVMLGITVLAFLFQFDKINLTKFFKMSVPRSVA